MKRNEQEMILARGVFRSARASGMTRDEALELACDVVGTITWAEAEEAVKGL